jgi:carbon monoxide dehydrogenase subunit G
VRFEGTFTVRAPRARVYSFFLNPQEFSTCIDDPHTIEVIDADHFRGTVKTGVSFIRGTFTWSADVKERVPPERAQLAVHGSGMGSGFDIVANLEMSEAGDLSTVKWSADVQMSGTIATVGARLLQGTTEKKTNAFFENARRVLEGK